MRWGWQKRAPNGKILWRYAHASPQNCLFWAPSFGTSFRSTTGEAHVCASAFSCLFRTKNGPLLCDIYWLAPISIAPGLPRSLPRSVLFQISIASRPWRRVSRPALRLASSLQTSCFAAISIALKTRGLPQGRPLARQLRPKTLARHQRVPSFFKFSPAGTPTIVLYSFKSPSASLCACANMFRVGGVASGKPRWASNGLESPRLRFGKLESAFSTRGIFHYHHNSMEKIVMIKTSRYKGLFWVHFLHLNLFFLATEVRPPSYGLCMERGKIAWGFFIMA